MNPWAGPARRHIPARQALFFIVAIVVPCVLLVALTLRMLGQERELADKRVADERKLLAIRVSQELLARVERIKLEAVTARATAGGSKGRTNDQSRTVALVAEVEHDRLVLPWDREPGESLAAVLDEPRFAEAVRAGERAELVEQRFDRAADAYRGAMAVARAPAQEAFSRLLLARALAKSGRGPDASVVYRQILKMPVNVVDDQGVPFGLYAARRLLDGPDITGFDREAIVDLLRASLAVEHLPPAAAYMVGDLAGRLASEDDVLGRAAAAVQALAADRARDVERALALQRAFPTLIPQPSVLASAREPTWLTFPPNTDPWLVTVTTSLVPSVPFVVAVRAKALLETLDGSTTSGDQAGRKPIEVRSDTAGEPLGPNFPGLSVALPPAEVAALVREGSLQRTFYFGALLLVLSVALSGGYLFWRDIQRGVRLAEMRSQFVSSVTHELKTPLTAIRMFAETLLLRRAEDPAARDEYLDTIVNESERLTRLLNNVLDFSRIEQGRKAYRLEPRSLPDVVRAAAKAMKYPLARQGFELRVEIDDTLPMIAADADAIEQAILNLLSNALKYSEQGRLIDLQLRKDAGHAVIAVTDRGLGIAASQHTRIFENFYRVESPENRAIPGTGLGLTLVDHVARAHGGTVSVRSAPGQGSTFAIVLPLGSERARAPRGEEVSLA